MGGVETFLAFVIISVIAMVFRNLFRGAEEERRPVRPRPGMPERGPRRPADSTSVDRFLEEINRRRREVAERAGAPAPRSPAPARPRGPASRSNYPRPQGAPPVAGAPAPARRSVRVEPGREVPAVEVIAEVVPVATPGARPRPPAAPEPAVAAAVVVAAPAPALAASQAAADLRALLRSPQSLRQVFLLKEILSPPLALRRPRRR